VTLSLRTYAQAAEATVKHLRTAAGAREVDLMIERADGRVVAVEVKLARDVGDRDTTHRRWLADRIGDELLDAVIVTTGPEAYRRADGIAAVPAALLGP
jgi:predicted AAA+ superfamily ATPase